MNGTASRVEALEIDIDRSCRYHQRRRAYYDTLHKIVAGLIILAGSSAVAGIFKDYKWFSAAAAALAAVLSTLDLVLGLSHRARDHELLYRRFVDLGAEIAESEDPAESDYRSWQVARLRIEQDEPPIYRALDISCRNEVIQARGLDPLEHVPLNWRWRWFMQIFRFADAVFLSRRELGGDQ